MDDIDVTNGTNLLKVVDAYLTERAWSNVERTGDDEGQPGYAVRVHSRKQEYSVFIEVYPRMQWLAVLIYTSFKVSEGAMQETVALLNQINRRVTNGWLSVEGEGYAIQFKQIYDAEGVIAVPKVISNMMDCGFDTFSKFGAAMAAVALTGIAASDAYHRFVDNDSEQDSVPLIELDVALLH